MYFSTGFFQLSLLFLSSCQLFFWTQSYIHTSLTKWCYWKRNLGTETKVYQKYSNRRSSTELTVNSRKLILAIQCEKNYFYRCLFPSGLRLLELVFQMKASAPNPIEVLSESPFHIPTFQQGSQNVDRSNYFRLNLDANGATSLALWLIQESRYTFHYFRKEVKWVWNGWAERKCNSFMSQYIGNSEGDYIAFVLVSAFYVPGCLSSNPLRKAHLHPHINFSLPAGARSEFTICTKLFCLLYCIFLWMLVEFLFGRPMLT